MILVRLLMLLLIGWIGWRILRLLTRQAPRLQDPVVEDMVPCALCAVHLPRHDAIRHGEQWFCSEAHRADYLARH